MVAPKIIFRCDGSSKIGSGHVMRCLSLGHYFSQKNADITFWVSEETIQTIPLLSESPFKITSNQPKEQYDWLIVDHYGLDREFETQCRSLASKIMVIDDLADREHDCDILLDQTLGRKESDYQSLISQHTKQLLGPDFAILKTSFTDARKNLDRSFDKPNKILICFGGVNPKQASEKTIKWLSQYNHKQLDIAITVGGNEKTAQPILEAIKQAEKVSNHQFTLYQNAQNMPELMAKSDLAIGAGGTMSWERCCMKLPSLAMELADNQTLILQNLSAAKALKFIGLIEDIDFKVFITTFKELIENTNALKIMSENAGEICDGSSDKRILKEMGL